MRFTDADWRPKKIKLVATKDKLTDATGLGAMLEVFDDSSLSKPFAACLPNRVSPRSHGSYRLGLLQVSSFLYGHSDLDDLEEFRTDPALAAIMEGETAAPRTMGDFLRDFEEEHASSLNKYLRKMAWSIRGQLKEALPEDRKPKALRLKIDTTSHEQSGEKMEGLAFNYKGKWCLDSQAIYDEFGLCYGKQLRAGNTGKGVGAVELIEHGFAHLKFQDEKYLSGDSAYCSQEPIKACIRLGVKFTFTANDATTEWSKGVDSITKWEPWIYELADKKKAELSGKELPKIEVGYFYWQPSWAEKKLQFPIVVKRTWVKGKEGTDLFGGSWEYYGVVTNLSLYSHTTQYVIEFHNERGNMENFIREDKYAFDLKHFPCQKLSANYAYLLLGAVAGNLMRWMALIEQPNKPKFAKKLRRRYVFLPGKVVTHARQIVFKISQKAYEEVTRLKQAWTSQPCPSFGTS